MIPKKIYLNYVNENDKEKTWSEEPVSVADCDMQNREYTDLSQVWHDASEEPNKSAWIISECDSGYINIDWGSLTSRFWYGWGSPTSGFWYGWGSFVLFHDVRRWAYIDDFIHKTMI